MIKPLLIIWGAATILVIGLLVAQQQRSIPDMSHRWPILHVAPYVQITHGSEPDEYPDGQYCTPNGDNFKGLQTPDNPCKCHIVMREDNRHCCEILQANDAVCKQFCHEHHCSCPHECIKYPDTPEDSNNKAPN